MGCPVSQLPYIMPAEEILFWAFRYEYGKFGKKLEDNRAAVQAKITADTFGDGKSSKPLENYMVKFEKREESEENEKLRALTIANGIFGGIVPTEHLKKHGNSSNPDSTPET